MDLYDDLPPPATVPVPATATSSNATSGTASPVGAATPTLHPLPLQELFGSNTITPSTTPSSLLGKRAFMDEEDEEDEEDDTMAMVEHGNGNGNGHTRRQEEEDQPMHKRVRTTQSPLSTAVASRRGHREHMQDRHTILSEQDVARQQPALVERLGSLALALVLDGHGGDRAATVASTELPNELWRALSGTTHKGSLTGAILDAFRNTDKALLKQQQRDGACAVLAIVHGDHLIVAHVGDCRAVLAQRRRSPSVVPKTIVKAVPLTNDHSPMTWSERQVLFMYFLSLSK